MRIWFLLAFLFVGFVGFSQESDSIQNNSIDSISSLSLLKDQQDGALDVSNFLATKTGFLPVPILITNPAVGYGAVMSVMFFHSSFEESKGYPSITTVLGGGTQNKSWLAGVFHMQNFWKKKIRYSGAVMFSNFNARFYGLGYTDVLKTKEVNMNVHGLLFMQKAVLKLGKSNFYSGLQYTYFNSHVSFEPIPDFLKPYTEKNITLSEIRFIGLYDSRDNFFSPSSGVLSQVSVRVSDQVIGATEAYFGLESYAMGYVPIKNKHQIGLKIGLNGVADGAPFFAQPFVNNRGVAFMRYQDQYVFQSEFEMQLNIYKRWSLVGFAGVGDAWGTNSNFFEKDFSTSGGAGFRYLLARKFGMKAGVDFAYDEQFAFQIVVGSAWLRN
ncbi:BamA/TamA family outer membrane protein [Cyclobacteriaceae bacterium]|nr:BamA/TamA family outer membrane protein [Cyclobacteriaceae bacterium]